MLTDDLPGMLVVQPNDKQRPGYIDLGVVSTDPANPIAELAAPLPQGDDAVTIFINRTIPMLKAAIVASDAP